VLRPQEPRILNLEAPPHLRGDVQRQNLGLLRAVEGFDPTMNTRFSTYASYWIKQSIKRALVNTAKPIRIPAYMVELLFKWRRAAADLQDELGACMADASVHRVVLDMLAPWDCVDSVGKALMPGGSMQPYCNREGVNSSCGSRTVRLGMLTNQENDCDSCDSYLGVGHSGASRSLVLLDGIPISEPDGVARLDLIELAAARQIEVVRGPVSALYAGSSNGVVNVISGSGADNPGVTLQAQGGSYGFEKYAGHAGAVIDTGQGSLFLAGSYTNADNFRAHSAGSVARGLLRTDYRFSPRTSLALDAEGSRLDTRMPGSLTQAQFDADPDAAAPSAQLWNFGRADTRYRVGLRGTQTIDASGHAEASAYAYYGGRTLDYPIVGQVVDLNFQRTQLGARYRAALVGGAPLELAGGVDYDRVSGQDQRWNNIGGVHDTLLDHGTDAMTGLGAYLQGEWRAATAVTLTLGLRYDAVEYGFTSDFPGKIPAQDTTFDQWSPKFTASWQAGANALLYASIAKGFEVPAVGELTRSPGSAISTTLHPKSLWNYEVGARGMLGSRARYDAAVFYADVDGEFVPVNSGGISLPENASQSRNVGVELGVSWLAARWLDISATYTFSDFRLFDYATYTLDSAGATVPVVYNNKQMPTIPQSRITADVVTRPLPPLSLGLQFEWQSQMYVETGNQEQGITYFHPPGSSTLVAVPFRAVPARALIQLNARYQAGPVGVFGSVDNLFGTVYTANVVANDLSGAYYEAGSGTWVSIGASVTLWPGGP